MRVELPGGQWAELRDPEVVTTRQRRPVERCVRRVRADVLNGISAANERRDAAEKAGDEEALKLALLDVARAGQELSDDEADAMAEANDAAIAALVSQWSYPQQITLDGVLDLPARAADQLRAAVAPLVNAMFLDATADPNRAAPSGGSDGSGSPSTGAQPTTSLPSGGSTDSSA